MTKLALKNAQFVIIVLLIAIVIGVRSFISMPRSEDPQVDFPINVISVAYPGTSPEDMETLIVDPLEEAINEIDDITRLEADIREGIAVISVEVSYDVDFVDKYNEIVREANAVRANLPNGIVLFNVERIKPADRVNFVMYALHSSIVGLSNLHDFAENLESQVENIPGINEVAIDAYPKEEIRVSLDFERMAAQNISLTQVVGILQQSNVNLPGGEVTAGAKNFTIESTGGYKRLDEIRNTIIAAGNNRVVYLKDVAQVSIQHEDQLWKSTYNGEPCIFVSLKLKDGFNILDVNAKVQAAKDKFVTSLPPNVHLSVAFEQASAVETRINDFFKNLLQGVLLVGIVIFLFLGWRASFIIVTLIPICAILALAILNGAGFGLQQISIASLVLALGLLVDNGIVVIENISRFIKDGYSKSEAALKGTTEVGTAIISSTITTLLSFFPLTQLGDAAGLFLQSLPITVILTLVISLILALSFSPIMSKWILKDTDNKQRLADKILDWFTLTFYTPILKFALRYGWIVLLAAVIVTGFSISLFPKIGVSFFPTADKALLLIDIDTPRGSSMDETAKAVTFVENMLDSIDLVDTYTTNIGHGSPQIYYNRIPKQFVKQHGQLLVNLKEWEPRSFYQTIANFRNAFKQYPGAKITVEELKNGAPVPAPIEIRIIGKELDVMKDLTVEIENILLSIEGVINVENPLRRNQTVLKVNLDKEKAGLLNVSELTFDQTIRASLNGLIIDRLTLEDQEEYNLVVRMPFTDYPDIEDFDRIYVTNRQGRNIPIRHISSIGFDASAPAFSHYEMDRFVAVTGSLVDLDKTIETTLEVIDKLKEMDWPADYQYSIGGEYEEQQSTFGNLAVILILAQVAIFAVLVLQFRSILQPFIVFSAIPLAICGSFIALYLSGWPFSFFAFIGLISLIGIVVNNSIIMVDYINQLRKDGVELNEAIILGSNRRFKPILLTTITTILGLVPLTLQATNQWSPLCWTIIGGMISSTLLALVVVPVLYKWFTKLGMKNT